MTDNAEQRRNDIVRRIVAGGKVKVTDLSRLYGISEVSIRNDLELLETRGVISRVHGGAVPVNKLYMNMNLNERFLSNASAKKALAQKAAELVSDNDTIMMNAGTTLTYVLRALQCKKNLSIVTNSVQNAIEANNCAFNVILLGGQMDPKYQFTHGQDTLRQLENYHAGKCILSLDGISASFGMTLYYPNEAAVIRKMMELSGSVIVAADSSKIGRNTFSRVAPISGVQTLITSAAANEEELQGLRNAGITVIEA